MDWNREHQSFNFNNGITLVLYKIGDVYKYDGIIYKNNKSVMRFQNLSGVEIVYLKSALRTLSQDCVPMDIGQAIIDACREH